MGGRAGAAAAAALAVLLAAGVPAAAQPSWGERLPERDVALADMGTASGVWSDGDTVWVSDWSGSAVRAYALRGGARRAGLDLAELPAANAAGLWSDGDTLWVADFDGDAVDARRLATGAAVAGGLAGLGDEGNDGLTGIWSDGTTLWAADYYGRKAYAYALSDGARRSSREFALAGTKRPFGLWSDGATLLAADWTGGRVLAYRLSDGGRLPDRDIDAKAAGNARPMGLWSDGATLWVTDGQDDKLYAYAVPGLLEVPVPAVTDASLASLTLSGVDIGTFASDKRSYAAEVANEMETTTVAAGATQSGATVAITPADADAQTPGHQVALAVGRTVVQVAVTAANRATRRTYAVTVTRPASEDATLGSLTLSSADIGAFSAQRLDYAGRVDYEVGVTTVAATATHGGATVEVSPADADDATPGHQVALAVGETAVEVRVTAQDRTTTRAYAVTVVRGAPSTDAALRSLVLTGVDLGPFDPDDLAYTGLADYELSTTTVTGEARAAATVEVSPADVDADAAGHQVRLAVGSNEVDIRVTAQDGATMRTYSATVWRGRHDASLRSLILEGVDLGPFDPDDLAYSGSVDYEALSTTTVTAEARDAAATVEVSPADADAAAGHQVRLAVGRNVLAVRVTAQDRTTVRAYTATVTRATPEGYQASVSARIGDDGRVRIEVPSATDRYHVLYCRPDADDPETEYAVAIHPGRDFSAELTEPARAGGGAYRVATYLNSAPGDVDGDGVDDLAELGRENVGARAPLNAAPTMALEDAATAIPDMETYRTLSYQFLRVLAGDRHLANLELVKFIITDAGTGEETIYYQNTNKWKYHYRFGRGLLGWTGLPNLTKETMSGEIVYDPNVIAPSGEPGTFRMLLQPHLSWSFEEVARGHELLVASMPFLRNNLVYYPGQKIGLYRSEKASYDASRVPVYVKRDLGDASVFQGLNAGVGYGLLRVLGPGERPTFRDVVILRHLPNELSAVAGVVSLQPQTPLSHVNLRAVQDGVPNAFVGNALDDPMVAPLVGKYVRYEVAEHPQHRFSWTNPATGLEEERAGYLVTEATAEQVAAHHEARRPAEPQTPARDLTVTAHRPLGSVAFADSDAFGVKAANLAALRTFGLTDVEVPDGHALPFYYYDEFMRHNGFYADVDALLADADFTGGIAVRDRELRKLRRRIENGAMPEWMTASLGALQGLFAEGVPIRCRSSTNNEDLPGFSGAGLYDSVTHRPGEGHLSKSVKQVYASLWNLRAFEERAFHRIDHKAAAMGVLLHPNFDGELANGVAVSDDPVYGSEDAYYVNAQVGENLVTNPSSAVVPEELLLTAAEDGEDGEDGEYAETLVQRSNLVGDDVRVLEAAHVATLYAALGTIHERFATLYAVEDGDEFSMEIEFKVTAADALAIKQARPWVY